MNRPGALTQRLVVDRLVRLACALAVGVALIPLGLVLVHVVTRGIGGLSVAFLTELPRPVGEVGGGMGNAVLGSLELIALASLIGIPIGILAGIYLAEYGNGTFGRVVRFAADLMAGLPSIAVGLCVYGVIVLETKHFSAWAGAIALAIIMLPTITRTTEELMRLVPSALREAALGLGIPRHRTTLRIVLRTALPGVTTGVMLAVARIAGESAPLLFTALGNRFWSHSINEPTAALPVQIFNYAISPYREWQDQAWTAALVLVVLVLALNLAARWISRPRVRST